MFGLTAPLWLVALAAIPFVRWLHRWRAPLRSAPVSAAFLWTAAADVSAGGQQKDRPDPAWRRRAWIIALLAIGLAGPWWQKDVARLTVWVDDSLSMSTVEEGEMRLQTGLAELARALARLPAVEATLRSLSDPAKARSSDDPRAFDTNTWLAGEAAMLSPPPVATLDQDTAYWLITDGADTGLRQWAQRAPLARIFNVGTATENVAVTQFAARRSLQDANDFDVLVAVSNAGAADASRTLLVETGRATPQSFELTLAAGETRYLVSQHSGGETAFSASLEPDDATVDDDFLVLDEPALVKARVGIDPACPEPLRQSIRAHPGILVVTADTPVELRVTCSQHGTTTGPVLRFHGGASAQVDVAPRWQPGVGRLEELHLPPGWIAAGNRDIARADGDEVLLAADDQPLIVVRAGSPVTVESALDMARGEFVRQPEYPVLVAALVDLALGRTLLDPLAVSSRDPVASRIAPSRLQVAQAPGSRYGAVQQALDDVFLALAALLLLADLALIWLAGRAARRG